MNQMLDAMTQMWSRLGPIGKVGASVIVGGMGFVIYLLASGALASYTPLYTNLDLETLGAIKAKLDADNVQYRLEGATLLVPAKDYDRLRIDLAVAGLPTTGGKGYELFDETMLGMSPYMQNINHTRAVQGELERTIKLLEPVQSARVHIVQPDPTPFIREQKPVTASVILSPKRGQALSAQQVSGIVALVSSSVKGLAQEHVTVVDSSGRMLSKRPSDPDSNASGDQLSHQREVEVYLATKAQDLLDRVLGYGQAVVRVSADMSFQHVKEMSEDFDPEARAVYEEILNSSKAENQPQSRGVAGAASNLPPVIPAAFSASEGSSQEDNIETRWHVSRTQRTSEEKIGSVDRLTVAVMLIPPVLTEGQTPEDALGITVPDATELVKQAVGYKEGRDAIQVTVGNPLVDESSQGPGEVPWYTQVSLTDAAAFVFAVAILFLVVGVVRNLKQRNAIIEAQRQSLSAEDTRSLETVAEALRVWVDAE